jgi:hypothetical protein
MTSAYEEKIFARQMARMFKDTRISSKRFPKEVRYGDIISGKSLVGSFMFDHTKKFVGFGNDNLQWEDVPDGAVFIFGHFDDGQGLVTKKSLEMRINRQNAKKDG